VNKTSTLITCAFIASILIVSCSSAKPSQTSQSGLRREQNPSVAKSDIGALVDGNNRFAVDIYKTLRSQNGNLILSPYSISLALAMTYAGARGETESQIAHTLHFAAQDQLHPAFNSLDLQLEKKPLNIDKNQEPLQLNIANAVWAEQTFSFLPEFLDTLASNYGAGIHISDFVNNFEPARKEINDWVSQQTQDKINNLLPENSVNADTRMVLVNAIYFKADWLDQFDPNNTHDMPFNLLDGTQVSVPTMNLGLSIPYASGDGYQAVELAYAGQTAAMEIIVPDAGRFDEIESSMTKDTLDEILGNMNDASALLSLPKFKFESSFSLPDSLKGLGMTDAFDADAADFSGMTGKKDLFISDVIHKAFVSVDEKGTEAAAATAVLMEAAGARLMDVNLMIDRPFIFLIRDLSSGQILFIGRVLNPTQK